MHFCALRCKQKAKRRAFVATNKVHLWPYSLLDVTSSKYTMRIYLHIALCKEIALYKSLQLGRVRGGARAIQTKRERQRFRDTAGIPYTPRASYTPLHAFTRLYAPLHASYTPFLDSIYSLVQMQWHENSDRHTHTYADTHTPLEYALRNTRNEAS